MVDVHDIVADGDTNYCIELDDDDDDDENSTCTVKLDDGIDDDGSRARRAAAPVYTQARAHC